MKFTPNWAFCISSGTPATALQIGPGLWPPFISSACYAFPYGTSLSTLEALCSLLLLGATFITHCGLYCLMKFFIYPFSAAHRTSSCIAENTIQAWLPPFPDPIPILKCLYCLLLSQDELAPLSLLSFCLLP